MIQITSSEISAAGGLLAALSRISTRVVKESLNNLKPNLPTRAKNVRQLLTHKSPHLDEYMAMLIFKASLPEDKWSLPFDEVILNSATNDYKAIAEWPHSAVFGLGAVHTGGAKPALYYDEHPKLNQVKKESSAAMLTLKLLYGRPTLQPELFKTIGEVDHIDCNATAHNKHLGNYIKFMHTAELALDSRDSGIVKDMMTPQWKQALVEASIAAFIVGIREKRNFTSRNFWLEPAQASLDHYGAHTLLKNTPGFDKAFERLRNLILEKYKGAPLTIRQADGTNITKQAKDGKPIYQFMTIPVLAGICQDIWGPELGQLILVHFWEARILSQLDFQKVEETLKDVIGTGEHEASRQTPIGKIDFRIAHKKIPAEDGTLHSPWIVELKADASVHDTKAVGAYVNGNNHNLGYYLLKDSRTGTASLWKGKGIPQEQWEKLIEILLKREGSSEEVPPGSWHVVKNGIGVSAQYVLNGNPAHQYTPRTELSADLLTEFVNTL